MKFEEALKAMREGKKAKPTKHSNYFYYIDNEDNDLVIVCEDDEFLATLPSIEILSENWEIVE